MALTQIKAAGLAADLIDETKLADDSIDSEHYNDGSIDHAHLANDCIDGDNIQDDVINSEHYVAGSIDHEHLANDAVDGDNIADDSIGAEHIADNAVGLAAMAHGTDGQIITYDASGAPTAVGPGTDGQVLTSTGAGSPPAFETISSSDTLSFRNLIINGEMQVNQRQSTSGLDDFNVVTGNLYTLDRWLGVGDSSFDWDSAKVKQVSDSPDGFSNSLRVDIGNTETPGAGQNGVIVQRIEAQHLQRLAYGTSSAKSCTLSFWVYSAKTGTYCVQIQQEDASKYLLYEYSISSADTWEKKTITFSGNTADAIANDNGNGLEIDFHLACHSDDHVSATTSWTATGVTGNKYLATSNQVNLWDHADNDWYLTGVQLEVGSSATDFEHRGYADELQRCQRYCQVIVRGIDSATTYFGGAGSWYAASAAYQPINFGIFMRTGPTVTWSTGTNHFTLTHNGTNDGTDDPAAAYGNWVGGTTLYYQGGQNNLSNGTAGHSFIASAGSASSWITASAEL